MNHSSSDMTAQRAAVLRDEIREGLINAERALKELIGGCGWLALGHDSFTDWFHADLADITLAAGIQVAVVYQLLSEGMTPEQAADEVGPGVGPESAAEIDRQRNNGVPADQVSRRGKRGSTRPADGVYVKLGTQKCEELAEIAAAYGQSLEETAFEFVDAGIQQWLPVVRRVAS